MEDIIEEIIGVEIMDETDQDHFDRTDAPVDYRDMDFARLKLLHNKISDEHLSPDEVNAVTAHLMANVPQIKSAFGTNAQAVQDLVRSSKVLNMKRLTSEVCRAGTKPQTEDMIYRRGKMSNAATLILNGRIGVQAGNEGFYSELGAWSCIAADAILEQEGTYIPDFTAFVISDTVRFLQITVNNPLLSTDDSNPQTTLDQDATATRVRLMKKTNSRKFKQAENRSALTTPSPRAKAMSLPDISESQKSYASTKNPLHPSTSGKSEKYDAESKGTSRNLLNPDLIKAESPRGKSPMRTEESARSDLSDLHRQDFSTGDSDEPYSPYQEL